MQVDLPLPFRDRQIRLGRLTLVYGNNGSGLTSLLQAAAIHARHLAARDVVCVTREHQIMWGGHWISADALADRCHFGSDQRTALAEYTALAWGSEPGDWAPLPPHGWAVIEATMAATMVQSRELVQLWEFGNSLDYNRQWGLVGALCRRLLARQDLRVVCMTHAYSVASLFRDSVRHFQRNEGRHGGLDVSTLEVKVDGAERTIETEIIPTVG